MVTAVHPNIQAFLLVSQLFPSLSKNIYNVERDLGLKFNQKNSPSVRKEGMVLLDISIQNKQTERDFMLLGAKSHIY